MEKYILAIDQGTTSTRAILFDKHGNLQATAQRECENFYPQPSWVEQNANTIWSSTVGVISEAVAAANLKMEDVAAIGITNQRETTIIWDKLTGQPIYMAIVWQSRQSDCYCQEMKQKGYEPLFFEKTGLVLDPYFSASKIRYILDHVEGAQARAERGELCFGTVDSFLIWKLTGGKVHVTDVSNASRTLLMNLHTLDYDEELLKLWNIPRCLLPEIKDTSCVYGLSDASLFGVQIPIAAAVGDQQAALFGQTCYAPGSVKNTYGTGCFLLMNTGSQIIHSKHGLLSCAGWKIGSEVNYVLEGSVFVAGAAIQWLRDGLKIIQDSSETYRRSLAVKSSDGVYVVPAFTGLGAPYWLPSCRGAIFGLTRGTSQDHLIRATLESLAYQTEDVLQAMQKDAGMKLTALKVDGGASKNDFLMQFQSDISNCDVHRSLISETTALGDACLAGLAVGFWKDKQEIIDNFKSGSQFTPTIDEEERSKLLEGWHRAIEAAMKF